MRALPMALLAAALLATGLAAASNHYVPQDNGTTFPDPEESTERGVRNDSPMSWFPVGLVVAFMVGVATLLFLAQRRFQRGR